MVSFLQLGLRSWTFLWTLLAMALIGNVIALAFSGNPASINFAMFTSALCMIVVIYGFVALFVEAVAIAVVLLVLDALATIFSLITGIVLAARLGAHSCTNEEYLLHNSLTNGSHHRTQRCRELQASTAFFWFMFAGFAGSLILSAMSTRGSGMGSRGARRGGPSMSQV